MRPSRVSRKLRNGKSRAAVDICSNQRHLLLAAVDFTELYQAGNRCGWCR